MTKNVTIINKCAIHQRTGALYWPVYGYCNKLVSVIFWKLQFIELFLEFFLRCNIFLYLLLMALQIEMCLFMRETLHLYSKPWKSSCYECFLVNLVFYFINVYFSLECHYLLLWHLHFMCFIEVYLLSSSHCIYVFFTVTKLQTHKLFRNFINRTGSNIHVWRIDDSYEFHAGKEGVGRI